MRENYSGAIVCLLAAARPTSVQLYEPSQYYDALTRLAQIMASLRRPFFLKFHPEQPPEEREFIASGIFTRANCHAIVMDDAVSIETICASTKLNLVNGISSIGIYAQKLGQRVFSYIPLFAGTNPAFVREWEAIKADLSIRLVEHDVMELPLRMKQPIGVTDH